MVRRCWLVALFASGCLRHELVSCGDALCPVGSICTPGGCATAEAVAACTDLAEGEPCTTPAIQFDGYCIGGACRQSICGNADIENGEVCDDGNVDSGDGCAARCDSTEVCGNAIVDPLADEQCDEGVPGRSRDGCTSICTSELDTWSTLVQHSFPAHALAAAATDTQRGRAVLFGGFTANGACLDQTWERDENGWWLRAPRTQPPARCAPMLAYDALRRRVVMFGGEDEDGVALGDTWEWDGVDWTDVTPLQSPSPRGYGAMAYDPIARRVLLFGGYDSDFGTLDETWSWDGAVWTQLAPAQRPQAVSSAGLARDPAGGLLLVGGFLDDGTAIGDVYRWDGVTWNAAPSIPARGAHGTAYDPIGDQLVVFGGYSNGPLDDTWYWNGTGWTQPSATTTTGRSGMTLIFDPTSSAMMSAGGWVSSNGETLETNTTLRLQGNWSVAPDRQWQHRYKAAQAYDPTSGMILLHGGDVSVGLAKSDTWGWDGVQWRWLADTGPSRHDHAMVFDVARRQIVLFGGSNQAGLHDETWTWNGATWTRASPTMSPPAREWLAMTYDFERRVVILFGGRGANNIALGDTWEWDGTNWSERTVGSSPPPLKGAKLAYDHARRRSVLFGGLDATATETAQTWEWDGNAWLERTPAMSPRARYGAGMTYLIDRQRVLLFAGGDGQSMFADTWEWDGTSWSRRLLPTIPSVRSAVELVYDPIGGSAISSGGVTAAGIAKDLVAYAFSSAAVPPDRCIAGVDTDEDGRAGCADADCWARCDPLCPPGVGATCDVDRPSCGDGTCSRIEEHVLCPSDCAP